MVTQIKLIQVCRLIETICPKYGCHVAMTGGCLYKMGERKDGDILFYRIRQKDVIDVEGLFTALEAVGFAIPPGGTWIWKATFHDMNLDLFFPEEKAISAGRFLSEKASSAHESGDPA